MSLASDMMLLAPCMPAGVSLLLAPDMAADGLGEPADAAPMLVGLGFGGGAAKAELVGLAFGAGGTKAVLRSLGVATLTL